MRFSALLLVCAFILAGCGSQTMTPDYAINVMPEPNGTGYAAIPPNCPGFIAAQANPFDSQPEPQFGCATARNLALMVDQPQDLLQGRNIGPAGGVTADGAILRYNNNQTRGLIELGTSPDTSVAATTAPTAASSLSGETPPAPGGSSAGGK